MNDNEKNKIALFRYGIIASLINDTIGETTKHAFFKNASLKVNKDWNGNSFKVSPTTIERWYYHYQRKGYEGLLPQARVDTGMHRKISDEVITEIEKIKSQYPRLAATVIYERLNASGLINKKEVSLSSITRCVKELDAKNNYKVMKEMRRYEKEHINELWCGDSSSGPTIKMEGRKEKTHLIALIDDASRMVVGVKIFLQDNFVNLMTVMKRAITTYGKPKQFNFDNGGPYKNGQMDLLAARIGVTIRYCEPYSPESKSKIERWFRTCKDHWMRAIDWNTFQSLEELEESLQEYVKQYNTTYHSSIDMTPSERFFQESEYIKRLSDKQSKESFFLERDCKVSADNIIILDKMLYEVPYRYSKQKIKIRYSYDLKDVYVVNSNGELTPIHLVDKISNSKAKRDKVRYTKEGVE